MHDKYVCIYVCTYICIDTYIFTCDISNKNMRAIIRRIRVDLGLLNGLVLVYFGMTCEEWGGWGSKYHVFFNIGGS